jgi:hypothetical protein
MKLCRVQLFNAGFLTDALLIWLLRAAGLEETVAGDFADFSVEEQSQWCSRYYAD